MAAAHQLARSKRLVLRPFSVLMALLTLSGTAQVWKHRTTVLQSFTCTLAFLLLSFPLLGRTCFELRNQL